MDISWIFVLCPCAFMCECTLHFPITYNEWQMYMWTHVSAVVVKDM